MKLFLTSFLLLASVSTVSSADNHSDIVMIASSPYPVLTQNKLSVAEKKLAIANTKSQYEWINKNVPNALGVVVNGNLTESDRPGESVESDRLFSVLNVPYYFGIGENELLNGLQDCVEDSCAIGGAMRLTTHINNLKKKSEESGRKVNFDFTQFDGYQFPELTTNVIGSLGYAVDMGKIYYIQLNNNGAELKDSVISHYLEEVNNQLTLRRYNIQINPILNWLETTLEYAAQQNKIIMVNKHTPNLDPAINNLLDKYDVRLRFSGNATQFPSQNKFYSLGFSKEKELLKLELNYDKNSFKIVHIKNLDLNQQNIIAEDQFVKHPTFYSQGVYPKRNQIISVRNQGAYVGQAKIMYDYVDPATGKSAEPIVSHLMSVGNIFIANVPKEATRVSISFIEYVGVFSYYKPVFTYNNLNWSNAPVVCYKTWGTTLYPKYEMVDSRIFNSQSSC